MAFLHHVPRACSGPQHRVRGYVIRRRASFGPLGVESSQGDAADLESVSLAPRHGVAEGPLPVPSAHGQTRALPPAEVHAARPSLARFRFMKLIFA